MESETTNQFKGTHLVKFRYLKQFYRNIKFLNENFLNGCPALGARNEVEGEVYYLVEVVRRNKTDT